MRRLLLGEALLSPPLPDVVAVAGLGSSIGQMLGSEARDVQSR